MTKQPPASNLASLAERIRNTLIGTPLSEKRMLGGITFVHRGNMLCCASKKGLMVRVGKDAEAIALAKLAASRCTGNVVKLRSLCYNINCNLMKNKDKNMKPT